MDKFSKFAHYINIILASLVIFLIIGLLMHNSIAIIGSIVLCVTWVMNHIVLDGIISYLLIKDANKKTTNDNAQQ